MKTIHVLSIGNSFSQDAQRYLHDLARHEGVNIQCVNLYIGGCSLERHYRNVKGDFREYDLEINGHSSTAFKASIKEALLAKSWDYITLQQVSGCSCMEETYQPYLNVLAAYVREMCPSAKLLIHQVWGYENGSERLESQGFANHEDMFAKMKACYDKAVADIHADGIIPSGQAFANMLQKVDRIHRDTFHASWGLGRFVLALVWYKYLTGNSVSSVTYNDFDEEINEQEYQIALEVVESLF